MKKKYQIRIFEIIEQGKKGDTSSILFDWIIMILIVLSIVSIVIESYEISDSLHYFLKIFEIISISIFTIEYSLRIYTAKLLFPENTMPKSIVKFILSPMAIIDLLAILPFYIPFLITVDLRFLRILRLLRIFRLLKFGRYVESLKGLKSIIKSKKEELIITMFLTSMLLFMAATIMFYIEHYAQPEVFSSIPATLWWAVATLTTVGYGDVYPITVLGKILAGIIAILGIGLVALPTGLISSGYLEWAQSRKIKNKLTVCPHCGKEIAEIRHQER